MKRHVLYIVRGLVLTGIICAVLYTTNRVLLPKYLYDNLWPTTATYLGFYQIERDTADVLFFGSSHAVTAFIPQELYNDYGITSYNLGCEQQNLLVSYYWMQEALKYQSPKVIILDCNMLFPYMPAEPLNTEEPCTRKAIDYMRWSRTKREAVRDICVYDKGQSELSYYMTNIRFHARWMELEENDFRLSKIDEHYEMKGFSSTNHGGDVSKYETFAGNVSDQEGKMEATVESMQTYLDKIIRLCAEEDIRLILVMTPTTRESVSRYHTLENIAADNKIPFYDFNEKEYCERINFDFTKDQNDMDHVNIAGALKVTDFLGEELSREYKIEAQKVDDWEKTREYYNEYLEQCWEEYANS